MLTNILLVGAGGFIGSISRYTVSLIFQLFNLTGFPFSTLIVNIIGCFTISFVSIYFKSHPYFHSLQLFLLIGFLGAFTTFSAFGLETINLFKSGNILFAVINILLNIFLSLIAILVGLYLGN